MKSNGRVGVCSLLFAGALMVSAGTAVAGPTPSKPNAVSPHRVEEARSHFANGMKHFDEGAFQPARDDFEKAYALAPSYKLLYNLALVQRQLGDPARSIQSFEAYLSQGAWEVPDVRVAEVTKALNEMAPDVGSGKVTANVPGVQITVDDKFVGQTPIEDVIVMNPGQHRIAGAIDGRTADSRVVTVAAGELVNVKLELKPIITEVPYVRFGAIGVALAVIAFVALRFLRRKPASIPSDSKAT